MNKRNKPNLFKHKLNKKIRNLKTNINQNNKNLMNKLNKLNSFKHKLMKKIRNQNQNNKNRFMHNLNY